MVGEAGDKKRLMGKDALEELWRQCKQREQLRLDDLTVFHGHATILEPDTVKEIESKTKELFESAPMPVKTQSKPSKKNVRAAAAAAAPTSSASSSSRRPSVFD